MFNYYRNQYSMANPVTIYKDVVIEEIESEEKACRSGLAVMYSVMFKLKNSDALMEFTTFGGVKLANIKVMHMPTHTHTHTHTHILRYRAIAL